MEDVRREVLRRLDMLTAFMQDTQEVELASWLQDELARLIAECDDWIYTDPESD